MTQDAQDAARWRALVSCARFRVLGTSRLGEPSAHIGLEVWGKYPGMNDDDRKNSDASRDTLVQFVDGLQVPDES